MSDMIKVGGLWKSQTKDGEMMLSGTFGYNIVLKVFKNSYKKEGDKGPDYNLYVAPKKQLEQNPANSPNNDDEMPF